MKFLFEVSPRCTTPEISQPCGQHPRTTAVQIQAFMVRLQRPLCLHCEPPTVGCPCRLLRHRKFFPAENLWRKNPGARKWTAGQLQELEGKLGATWKVSLSISRQHQNVELIRQCSLLVSKIENTPTLTKKAALNFFSLAGDFNIFNCFESVCP